MQSSYEKHQTLTAARTGSTEQMETLLGTRHLVTRMCAHAMSDIDHVTRLVPSRNLYNKIGPRAAAGYKIDRVWAKVQFPGRKRPQVDALDQGWRVGIE